MALVLLDDVTVDFTIYGAQKSFRQALFARAAGGFIRRETGTRRVTVRALDRVGFWDTMGRVSRPFFASSRECTNPQRAERGSRGASRRSSTRLPGWIWTIRGTRTSLRAGFSSA